MASYEKFQTVEVLNAFFSSFKMKHAPFSISKKNKKN